MAAFEEMGVLPEISKAVDSIEWALPTDVQAEAIPLILGGGDVLMAAETGSGKTGAFCLPIVQTVWETLNDFQTGKAKKMSVKSTQKDWTLCLWDRGEALAVAPDGLRCQSREQKEWHGCRANKGVHTKGKYYFEVMVADEGLCRVGWSTPTASLDLGTDKFGFGFGGTGKKSNNKKFDDYGEPYGMKDVIGCHLDLDNWCIRFSKNGTDLGEAYKIPNELRKNVFFPAITLKNCEVVFNFGSLPFQNGDIGRYLAISKATPEVTSNSGATADGNNSSEEIKPSRNAPQAIIVEPSRELAEQTFNQTNIFKKYLRLPEIQVLLLIGGVSIKDQMAQITSGVDIVVATPGRLEEFINSGHISLTHCRFFVLDEADGLLNGGHGNLIERIHKKIPKITHDGKRLQMIVCSATLHSFEVKKMAEKLMHFPTWIDLKGEDAVPETVHHVVVIIDPQKDQSWKERHTHIETDGVHANDRITPHQLSPETLSEAVKILKGFYTIQAIDKLKMDRAIIFCRTKIDCDNLEQYFIQLGGNNVKNPYSCVCLHGDRKPQERKANLEKFKQEKAKFLICTDVAARGLDIVGLPFMINVTLPDEKSNYVHRIGRVGRAERMGLAISLVSSVPEKVWYHGEWCTSRGRNCSNTNLTTQKGCCIWYNELRCLGEIEEHLNITIDQIQPTMEIPVNDFDGKVVYGQKRTNIGSTYETHVKEMEPILKELSALECNAQVLFLQDHIM